MRLLIASILVLAAVGGSPALAALQKRPAAPTEAVWRPAETPPGGVSWATLESTKEVTRTDKEGLIRSKPIFSAPVKALAGKKIKVNGYMLPLQKGAKQTHFVLLAYPPDCPFHLNPAPMQFIEVKTSQPATFSYDVLTIEGTLQLSGQDEAGIFYKIYDGRTL